MTPYLIVIYFVALIWPMKMFYMSLAEAFLRQHQGKKTVTSVHYARVRWFQNTAKWWAMIWPVTIWPIFLLVFIETARVVNTPDE